MELRTYIFIILGSIIVFYLMGYEAPAVKVLTSMSEDGGNPWQTVINELGRVLTDPAFLGTLGLVGFTTLILSPNNYSVGFIIPILFLIVLSNIFVLPTSFITDAQLPGEIKTLALLYLNGLLTLGAIEFVRGGGL